MIIKELEQIFPNKVHVYPNMIRVDGVAIISQLYIADIKWLSNELDEDTRGIIRTFSMTPLDERFNKKVTKYYKLRLPVYLGEIFTEEEIDKLPNQKLIKLLERVEVGRKDD